MPSRLDDTISSVSEPNPDERPSPSLPQQIIGAHAL